MTCPRCGAPVSRMQYPVTEPTEPAQLYMDAYALIEAGNLSTGPPTIWLCHPCGIAGVLPGATAPGSPRPQ